MNRENVEIPPLESDDSRFQQKITLEINLNGRELLKDGKVGESSTYFEMFFDDEIFELLVYQSNLYDVQRHISKPLSVTKNEVEQFIEICVYMSIYNLPRTKMYWAQSSRISQIADVMSRNIFLQIKSSLHMNDSDKVDMNNLDRLYKVSPFIGNMKRLDL
ncbi:hypothetical protein ILUMI_14601 [Ignelater luminosus]|uniref:PiggyBac transposable element-derived protein domain-containing protein n=1 Tax=Ignelater luminosus TaxID=2038154 RepID=A0A8K0CUH0_IGNLU|nr:hypothetical protein ILUMI_14601 [Ignelater luminosus]